MNSETSNLNITEVEPTRYLRALDIEKLNKSEDRTINPIFGVYHIRALVCGSSGSGKTTFVLNYLLQNLDEYKLILYLAPTESLESGFLNTVKNIQNLKNKIVFLDIINVLTSKDDIKQINAYLTQSSRASCDLFLLVQTYNKISPSIATNLNTLILFPKYMSRDSFNACIRRSFTGEYNKKIGDEIYNTLRHTNPHKPFIFINDQPADKSIIFNNYYLNFDFLED